MTFLQLVQQFFREIGYSGVVPTTVVSQTKQKKNCVDWIAEADYLINTRWADWNYLWKQWSRSTVVGTANYAAPSDIATWDKESFYLNYTADTHTQLSYLPYKEWREVYRQGTKTNALPDVFTILPDKSVTLEAPPDAIYTLTSDYWKAATKMSADTDTPEMPTEFQRIIVVRAKLIHAEFHGDQSLYQLALVEYNELLDRLEADQLPDRYDRHSEAMATDIMVL